MTDRAYYLYERLPPSVVDLAHRLGARPTGGADVRLSQIGRMRQAKAARWGSFRARQTIALSQCEFSWRARAGPGGAVTVRDAFAKGAGHLDVRAFGVLPLAHVGPSVSLTRGELIRYLAELAWAPDAIVRNVDLFWREDGPDRLIVGAGAGETAVEVTLTLDGEGRIAEAFAPARDRLVDGVAVPTPWRGTFSEYRLLDQTWLPFAGEVSWSSPEGEWPYWQGRIEHWARTPKDE